MYQAKLLKINEQIEEEVTLEINFLQFVGFAYIRPYKIKINESYPVILSLTILDDPEIVELGEPRTSFEIIKDTYGYVLYGKICDDKIDIGNGIKIQDDIFIENSYLNGKYIKMKIDRLAIEFI
ncbi:MAG: hypothetical protein ACYC0J_00360 [Gammaproteobacteria bacterium]